MLLTFLEDKLYRWWLNQIILETYAPQIGSFPHKIGVKTTTSLKPPPRIYIPPWKLIWLSLQTHHEWMKIHQENPTICYKGPPATTCVVRCQHVFPNLGLFFRWLHPERVRRSGLSWLRRSNQLDSKILSFIDFLLTPFKDPPRKKTSQLKLEKAGIFFDSLSDWWTLRSF